MELNETRIPTEHMRCFSLPWYIRQGNE